MSLSRSSGALEIGDGDDDHDIVDVPKAKVNMKGSLKYTKTSNSKSASK
jgi:hypothetical protein